MRLPNWIRLIILVSAIMKTIFGVTLLIDPGQIGSVWPWPLPALSARLLGASTLVSVPLALLSIGINRYAMLVIPFVMMITYRALQLAAGLIHIDRFDLATTMSVNYFGGSAMMLALFGYVLWAGSGNRLRPAPEGAPFAAAMAWTPPTAFRWLLRGVAAVYIVLGLMYLYLGKEAAVFWIDASGMTPLTARLFASPLIGLGLGLFLVSRAGDWREAVIPAAGMVTVGIAGNLAMALELDAVTTRNAVAGAIALTPAVLFVLGAAILLLRPKARVSA